MTHRLGYAAPGTKSRWAMRCRAAAWAAVPALGAAAAACLLSSATVLIGRWLEGQPTLNGLPRSGVYRLCIELIPVLVATAIMPIAWAWAVWRAEREDRLAVGCFAIVPLSWIWHAAMFLLFCNSDRTFP